MTLESIAIIGAVSTVIAGFGGAALGALFSYRAGIKLLQISHKNDIDLLRIQEYNKASAIFRIAFIDQIFQLQKNAISGNEMVNNIISDDVVCRHEKAKIIFESFIPNSETNNFNKAWDKYKNGLQSLPNATSFHPANINNRKELSQHYLVLINNLLSYANF